LRQAEAYARDHPEHVHGAPALDPEPTGDEAPVQKRIKPVKNASAPVSDPAAVEVPLPSAAPEEPRADSRKRSASESPELRGGTVAKRSHVNEKQKSGSGGSSTGGDDDDDDLPDVLSQPSPAKGVLLPELPDQPSTRRSCCNSGLEVRLVLFGLFFGAGLSGGL
jgi:hypothetical protein